MKFIKLINKTFAFFVLMYSSLAFGGDADTLLKYAKESNWDAVRSHVRSYIKTHNTYFYIGEPERINEQCFTYKYRRPKVVGCVGYGPVCHISSLEDGYDEEKMVCNTEHVNYMDGVIELVKKINLVIEEVVEEYLDEDYKKHTGRDRQKDKEEASYANSELMDLLFELMDEYPDIDIDEDYRDAAFSMFTWQGLGSGKHAKKAKESLARHWKEFREMFLKYSYLKRAQGLLKRQNDIDKKLKFGRARPRKEYKDAWSFIANSDYPGEDAKSIRSLTSLIRLDADLTNLILKEEFYKHGFNRLYSLNKEKIEERLLNLFTEDGFYRMSQEAMLRFLMSIKMGSFDYEIKERAARAIRGMKKKDLPSYKNAVKVIAEAMCEGIKNFEDLEKFSISLGIWNNLLLRIYSDIPKSHIKKRKIALFNPGMLTTVCDESGLCSVMHKAMAFVGAAYPGLEKTNERIAKSFKLEKFEEVLRIIKPNGEYIGNVYMDDNGVIVPNIRELTGRKGIFEQITRGYRVRRLFDSRSGEEVKKAVLQDGTVIKHKQLQQSQEFVDEFDFMIEIYKPESSEEDVIKLLFGG